MLHARHDGRAGAVKTFTLIVQDATHAERSSDVLSFVGEDDSGSFGLMADHARFITCLKDS